MLVFNLAGTAILLAGIGVTFVLMVLRRHRNAATKAQQSEERSQSEAAELPPQPELPRPGLNDKRLPRGVARWRVALTESKQRFTGEARLYVIEDYPAEYWRREEPFELKISAIELWSGERQGLPPLSATGSFTTGQGVEINGSIFVNAGRRLMRLDPGGAEWRVIVDRPDASIQGAPIGIAQSVFCAWNRKDGGFVVSRNGAGGTTWSAGFPEYRARHVTGDRDGLYVLASQGEGGTAKTTVFRFEIETLETRYRHALPFLDDAAEVHNGTLYVGGSQTFRVLPPGPIQEVTGPRSIDELQSHPGIVKRYLVREQKWEGVQDTGLRGVGTLVCLATRDLHTVAVQPVAGQEIQGIAAFGCGVVVASQDLFQCAIERLDQPSGRLVPLIWCPGTVIGSPVIIGDSTIWLVENREFEDLRRAMAGERVAKRYRLITWSSRTRTETSVTCEWEEPFEELLQAGADRVVLAGYSSAVAIAAVELGVEGAPSMPAAPERESYGGPRIDQWAYEHPDEFLAGLLKDLVRDADGFWSYSPEERMKLLSALRQHWIRAIRQELSDAGAPLPSPAFVSAGRFLLFEFIRENKHQVSIDETVWPYLESPFFREVIAWCNRGALSQEVVLRQLGKLSRRWPKGAVPLFDDWRAYRDLMQELFACGLLGGKWLDSLEFTVRQVWGNAQHPSTRHVFLSYSHRDGETARRFAAALRERGVTVAFDDWQPAADVDDRQVELWIAENIVSSGRVVYLLSENALTSGWIRRESEWERRMTGLRNRFVLPFIVVLDPSRAPADYPKPCMFETDGLRQKDEALMDAIADRILRDASAESGRG